MAPVGFHVDGDYDLAVVGGVLQPPAPPRRRHHPGRRRSGAGQRPRRRRRRSPRRLGLAPAPGSTQLRGRPVGGQAA